MPDQPAAIGSHTSMLYNLGTKLLERRLTYAQKVLKKRRKHKTWLQEHEVKLAGLRAEIAATPSTVMQPWPFEDSRLRSKRDILREQFAKEGQTVSPYGTCTSAKDAQARIDEQVTWVNKLQRRLNARQS